MKARYAVVAGNAARSISMAATSISPALSSPWRQMLLPPRYSGIENPGHVVPVSVQFDLNTIREVLARAVDQDVSACHQEQSPVALEKEAGCVRQQPLPLEGRDTCCGEKQRLDHRRTSHSVGRLPCFGVHAGHRQGCHCMEYCPLATAARARWSAPARLRSFRAVKPTTELESFVTFGRMATASNSESTTEGRGGYPKDRLSGADSLDRRTAMAAVSPASWASPFGRVPAARDRRRGKTDPKRTFAHRPSALRDGRRQPVAGHYRRLR